MSNNKEMQERQKENEYIQQIRKECAMAIAERDERIACLTAENIKLKQTIATLKLQEESNTDESEEFELDMQKILRPDSKLELAVLCRDLGLMEED